MTNEKIQNHLFQELDANHDGVINYQERVNGKNTDVKALEERAAEGEL